MKQSILLNTDSYKASMFKQYPEGTETVFSYIESRGGKSKTVLFFGLQAFIKEYLTDPITMEDIDEAEAIWLAHGEPFNRAGWEYIVREHDGFLPVRIRAADEGLRIPVGNVMVTIENTDPACFWLTTYLETALLRAVWYPTTVATISRSIKRVIRNAMEVTGSDMGGLPFNLHDFGARGVSSNESAMIGGMAHLVNFMGTDTIAAVVGAKRYYGEDMAGFSIPAAEHSTITSWGREGEVDAYRNMLKQFAKPGSIVAVVSDSYDIYNAVENLWGDRLRDEVINSGATLVVRPDSGDPATVVLRCAQLLEARFGVTVNDKGFKVLNNVRIIQGDGINEESIKDIIGALIEAKFSIDNIAFGMGGALLGAPQRDDQKFAMKCSTISVNGEWRDVMKDPITDPGKRSKVGRLALVRRSGLGSRTLQTIPEEFIRADEKNLLNVVFENGKLVREHTLAEIRERADLQPEKEFTTRYE